MEDLNFEKPEILDHADPGQLFLGWKLHLGKSRGRPSDPASIDFCEMAVCLDLIISHCDDYRKAKMETGLQILANLAVPGLQWPNWL